MGVMGDWESIASSGEMWWGHTNSQIACLFVSHGLLQQFGSTAPTVTELGYGYMRMGMAMTIR